MKKRFSKKEILTIPNFISFFRIALIPLFLWLYCAEEKPFAAIAVLAVSGISDIADGIIARRFNMVSDFGKLLDPVADKLTQAALILSLSVRYPEIWALFFIFVGKEITMGVMGLVVLEKTDTMNSAQWFGKATTFVFEASMAILLLFPSIHPSTADLLFLLCGIMVVFSLTKYLIFYFKLLKSHEDNGQA